MPTTKNPIRRLRNNLLRALLAAAFDAGDMETAFKLSAILDAQQIHLLRKDDSATR